MVYSHKDESGNEIVLNGRYVTKVSTCRRITEGSIVRIQDLQDKHHVYVYGEKGGSAYIRGDLLTKVE